MGPTTISFNLQPRSENAYQTSVGKTGRAPLITIHSVFDITASVTALAVTAAVYRWRIAGAPSDPADAVTWRYFAALLAGAILGAYGLGTLNLWVGGIHGTGRSILGAFAGSILAIEIYKRAAGIERSTGLIFVAGFSASVSIGRIGCLLSGLADQTYGIPTGAAWGWDFGDGILRHPVALYESASMAVFLVAALYALATRQAFFLRNGFYLLALFYASQRFLWEFFKPYATIIGPLNVFHLTCIALAAYAIAMIAGDRRHERALT